MGKLLDRTEEVPGGPFPRSHQALVEVLKTKRVVRRHCHLMTLAPESTDVSSLEHSRPREYRLTELEVNVAELRHKGHSLASIDHELRLGEGAAAKILKRLRNKAPGLIRLVRRLQEIHYWEKLLDRKTHLEGIRQIQLEAKGRGVWRYGRVPSGYWLSSNAELKLEPIESEVIATCGERILRGEIVYHIAQTAGYDHRTLRDILKNPMYKTGQKLPGIFSPAKWERMQQMMKSPPKGDVGWGFKRFGSRKVIDDRVAREVQRSADLRITEWSANRIAAEFGWETETAVGRLKRMHNPNYQDILGAEKWKAFVEADNQIKKGRVETTQQRRVSILRFLERENANGARLIDVQGSVQLPATTVLAYLRALAAEGKVVKTPGLRGRWHITQSDSTPVENRAQPSEAVEQTISA
jgi:hypothetical protein